ncbi:MAG: hypothetical protein ACR2P8_01290 [Myxococcota bacterium]
MRFSPRHPLALALLALLALGASACITRPVKEKVFSSEYTETYLRWDVRGTKTVPKSFEHPAAIAPVRLAHILSRIDMRQGEGAESKRVPAIPLDTLFLIGDAMAQGLAKADSDQEVVIQSIRKGKHLYIFDRWYLTSLLAYVQNDMLYIHISRSDWEIPAGKKRLRTEDRLPETHVGKYPLDFRLVVDRGMTLADHQSVAVEWKDPIFKKPTRTRVTPSGRVVRREVLMESFEDTTVYDEGPKVEELTGEQLRALADLDDARRAGQVSESEYYSRKNAILRGELPAP